MTRHPSPVHEAVLAAFRKVLPDIPITFASLPEPTRMVRRGICRHAASNGER